MLNSITCDTDPSEIIKDSDISSVLEELEDIADNYQTNVERVITEEQSGSGLSRNAFYISNDALLYDDANQVISDMKVKSASAVLIGEIKDALNTQRMAEINKLLEKIDEKIQELKAELDSIPGGGIIGLFTPNSENNVRRREIETTIKFYKNKRSQVEGMK